MPLKAYPYIRMSTAEQQYGDSERRQRELCIRVANHHDWLIQETPIYADIGVSAFKGNNRTTGALGRFIEDVKNGSIERGSFLLVENHDRLSREDVNTAWDLVRDIQRLGIHIVTTADGQIHRADDVGTDVSKLFVSILAMARANEESRVKSQRVAAAWRNKRALITTEKLTKIAPAWLQLSADRTSFELIQPHAEIVRRAFTLAADGWGSNALARLFNGEGIQAIGRGKAWIPSYVTKTLSNRAVLGEFQPHQLVGGRRQPVGDPVADYFPRIIDDGLFLRVQHGRHTRRTLGRGRKGKGLSNLFSGIAKCGYCGSPMRFVNKGQGPKGGTYLTCSKALHGLGCVSTGWRYSDFETSFLLFAKDVDLRSLMSSGGDQQDGADLSHAILAQREVLRQREATRARTIELLLASSMEKSEAIRWIEEKEVEVTEAKRQLASLLSEQTELSEGRRELTEGDQELIALMRALPADQLLSVRTKIAGRLKDVVSSLLLEVEGPKWMPDDETRAVFGIARSPKKAPSAKRFTCFGSRFKVAFSNGHSRTVEVSREDPATVRDGYERLPTGRLSRLDMDGDSVEARKG